jgi:prepilin-type N-terminal cleavage/methylation domain-containing protein
MNTGFGRHRKGMTLVELVIALAVISIAAVGTGIAFYASSAQLNRQRYRMRAQDELRVELEFWIGITHTYIGSRLPEELKTRSQPREFVLNENATNPITASIHREAYLQVMEVDNPDKLDHFQITVTIEYYEPPLLFSGGSGEIYNTYSLIGYWIPRTDS